MFCVQEKYGGATPLWIAADNGHLEVVQMLLQAQANPNKVPRQQ